MAKNGIGWGILLGCVLHGFQIVVVFLVALCAGLFGRGDYGMFVIMGWGVTQFLYMGPAMWLLVKRGQKQTAAGVAIVAGLGVLLNGACDGLLFSAKFH